jgi:hypothetical protein
MPPWSPRTQLPFPAALKVFEQGIHPSNYMGNAINNVTPDFIKALDEAGVKDVEDFLKGLSKIEVK